MALVWEFDTEYNYTTGKTTGYSHRVEIIDTQGGTPSDTFCGLVPPGVVVRWEGNSRTIWQTIQAQTCEFTMILENDNHVQFVRNLGLGQEYRFVVRYKRNNNLMFVGIIFIDEVILSREQDVLRSGSYAPHGYFTVTATNALGLLQNTPYHGDDNVPYTAGTANIENPIALFSGREVVCRHIGNAMKRIPGVLQAYLPVTPIIIVTNWSADVGGTPWMEHIAIDHRVFQDLGRTEGVRAFSCFDVLKLICEAWDFRLIVNFFGRFIFEQLNTRVFGGNFSGYQIDGTPVGGGVSSPFAFEVDCEGPLWKISPDTRALKPPLRSSTVQFETDLSANYLFGKKWSDKNTPITSLTDSSEICFSNLGPAEIKNAETPMRMRGNIEFWIYDIASYPGLIRPVFYITINVGTYYYVRDLLDPAEKFNPTIPPGEDSIYDAEEWVASDSEFTVVYTGGQIKPFKVGPEGLHFEQPIWFVTKFLPVSEDDEQVKVCLRCEFVDENSDPLPSGLGTIGYKVIWEDADLAILDSEENIVEQVKLDVTILNDSQNTRDLSRKILMSDGFNEFAYNRLTDDQSPPEKSTTWTNGIGSAPHYELLARTIMSRGMSVQEYLDGEIKGPYDPTSNLLYDGITWVWMQGAYNSGTDRWIGEWFKLEIGAAGSLPSGEEEVFVNTPGPPGVDSTVAIANTIRPYYRELNGAYETIDIVADAGLPPINTTGWSDNEIASRFRVFRNGIMAKYNPNADTVPAEERRIDEYRWDNATKEIVFGERTRDAGENTDQDDWIVILLWI
jgi:hypothetical protein